jgi:hypothetical protein
MKYRISLGINSFDGTDIYRVYRVEGETQVLLDGASTLDRARGIVERLKNPKQEVTVEEIES